MQTIYEPKGKAREYSPLALNLYKNCDHKCRYCYVAKLFAQHQFEEVVPRLNIIQELEKDIQKLKEKRQVLLSFTGDPYCRANDKFKITRRALKLLLKNNIPVAILTKGGKRCLQDLDIFIEYKDLIKVGMTLTFVNLQNSQYYEPNASTPQERFDSLRILYENKIKTWVSIEPVIFEDESLQTIKETYKFVDHYKVGLTNYFRLPKPINWKQFGIKAINLLRELNKPFYIKEDLRFYTGLDLLKENEADKDFLAVKSTEKQSIQPTQPALF